MLAPSFPPNPSLPPNSLRASLIEGLRANLPASLRPSAVHSIRPSLIPKLRERSLSPWAVLAMGLMALPLAVSVLVAQALFSRDVVTAYDDAATRLEEHVVPAHQLELAIWQGQTQADQYFRTKDPKQLQGYRKTRVLIRAKFASLEHYAQTNEERAALDEARLAWDRADDLNEGNVGARPANEGKDPESTNTSLYAAVNALQQIEANLALDMRARHVAIAAAHQRAQMVTSLAAALSTLVFLITSLLIWRGRVAISRWARVLKRQEERRSRYSTPAKVA